MALVFDTDKDAKNFELRGLRFEDVARLRWETAKIISDTRKEYGEARKRAFVRGPYGLPYVVVYTMRGLDMRVISFRRAHEKEIKHYEEI